MFEPAPSFYRYQTTTEGYTNLRHEFAREDPPQLLNRWLEKPQLTQEIVSQMVVASYRKVILPQLEAKPYNPEIELDYILRVLNEAASRLPILDSDRYQDLCLQAVYDLRFALLNPAVVSQLPQPKIYQSDLLRKVSFPFGEMREHHISGFYFRKGGFSIVSSWEDPVTAAHEEVHALSPELDEDAATIISLYSLLNSPNQLLQYFALRSIFSRLALVNQYDIDDYERIGLNNRSLSEINRQRQLFKEAGQLPFVLKKLLWLTATIEVEDYVEKPLMRILPFVHSKFYR